MWCVHFTWEIDSEEIVKSGGLSVAQSQLGIPVVLGDQCGAGVKGICLRYLTVLWYIQVACRSQITPLAGVSVSLSATWG